MTIGIYALYWKEQDLIYIGQSQNIENRFKEHLNKLGKAKHTNYKVQNAYNKYGRPKLVLLEECSIEQLNELEIYYTKEFDSINNGLNIIEAGLVGWGVNSNASKYTKRQILKVFSLLYRTELNYPLIAKKLGVDESLPKDIKAGRVHSWLASKYPDQYKLMLSRDSSKIKSLAHTKHYSLTFINKDTEELVVTSNVAEFIRDYSLIGTHVYKLISGKRQTHKGWSVKT